MPPLAIRIRSPLNHGKPNGRCDPLYSIRSVMSHRLRVPLGYQNKKITQPTSVVTNDKKDIYNHFGAQVKQISFDAVPLFSRRRRLDGLYSGTGSRCRAVSSLLVPKIWILSKNIFIHIKLGKMTHLKSADPSEVPRAGAFLKYLNGSEKTVPSSMR
jgi:hypothetical protein